MYLIDQSYQNEIVINKSRFIAYLSPVVSEAEVLAYLTEIRQIHPKATHHCYAFILNEQTKRSNDAGEPAGTAGLPILETLMQHQLTQVILIVVRYYGGIKLGAGGLIRAYRQSANQVISQATIYQAIKTAVYQIFFPYSLVNLISQQLADCLILEKQFKTEVSWQFATNDESIIKSLINATSGQVIPELIAYQNINTLIKEPYDLS